MPVSFWLKSRFPRWHFPYLRHQTLHASIMDVSSPLLTSIWKTHDTLRWLLHGIESLDGDGHDRSISAIRVLLGVFGEEFDLGAEKNAPAVGHQRSGVEPGPALVKSLQRAVSHQKRARQHRNGVR